MDNGETTASIAHLAAERGAVVAVAESLTAGAIASELGAAPSAANWFAGAVVAYTRSVKHSLLQVSPGPVVCASAAQEMASEVARLLGATYSVAVTGAGGPEPQDDREAGTVFLAVASPTGVEVQERHFAGPPEQVVKQTVREALRLLEGTLRS